MPLVEILRLLREKASTPPRIVAVLSLYLAYAVYERSPLYEPFLAEHSDLLVPVSGLGMVFWVIHESFSYLSSGGHLPATRSDLYELRGEMTTLAGRQTRLADTIGEPYWETDATGRMIFSNYANAQLYGTTARDILRSGTAPYIHKNDLEMAYRAFKQAIEGRMGFSIEFDVVARGEYMRSIRVYAWPLFDENDTFMGHYGSAEVTEDLFDEDS